MNRFKKAYYKLTSRIARKFPENEKEYAHFKNVLTQAYNVPDTDPVWIMVSGQITSAPSHHMKKRWSDIANAAKRLNVNNMAMGFRHQSMKHLNEQLEKSITQESERLASLQNDQLKGTLHDEETKKELTPQDESKNSGEEKIPLSEPTVSPETA